MDSFDLATFADVATGSDFRIAIILFGLVIVAIIALPFAIVHLIDRMRARKDAELLRVQKEDTERLIREWQARVGPTGSGELTHRAASDGRALPFPPPDFSPALGSPPADEADPVRDAPVRRAG